MDGYVSQEVYVERLEMMAVKGKRKEALTCCHPTFNHPSAHHTHHTPLLSMAGIPHPLHFTLLHSHAAKSAVINGSYQRLEMAASKVHR